MSDQVALQTSAHLVGHLLREIESALRTVLVAVVPEEQVASKSKDQQRVEIQAILNVLGIDETDPIATGWLALAEQSYEYALHRLAHRDSLGAPRSVDQNYREFWDRMVSVLDAVAQKTEGSEQADHGASARVKTSRFCGHQFGERPSAEKVVGDARNGVVGGAEGSRHAVSLSPSSDGDPPTPSTRSHLATPTTSASSARTLVLR